MMNAKKVRILLVSVLAALWLALSLAAWFSPAEELSDAERRKLQQFPKLSTETVFTGKFMSDFETYTQDQFPLRDSFRRLKAVFSYQILHKLDNNGIYLEDGYAAQLEYPLSHRSVEGALKKFNKLHDLYLKDCGDIFFALVPDKGLYLAEANGYPSMDYDGLYEAMEALSWAEHIDIRDLLTIEDYYRTDTHWRQEHLLPVARKLTQALGVTQPKEEDYTVTALERPFYGVYYGQAALPLEPDTISLLENELLGSCRVTNHETGTVGSSYDLDKLTSRDLYDVYLSGPAALLTIENPNAATDKELIVFRDSFGSSLIPLLIADYAKVTVIDTRYVVTEYVGNFVDFQGQDVLMLYSTLVLNNSDTLR